MVEGDAAGVEPGPAEAGLRLGAVEGVSGDGVPDAGEVDANLVGPAGADAHFEQGEAVEALHDLEFGVGGAAGGEAGGHPGPADGVAGNWFVDDTGFGLHLAFDKGPVDLFDGPAGELGGESAVGCIVAGDEEDAAGAGVEAVDDPRAQIAAHAGESPEMVQKSVDERAGFAAGARVDDEAGGLVDGDQVVIFEENVEGDLLGFGAQGAERSGFDVDALAAPEPVGGFAGAPVHQHAAGVDPLLKPRAAELRQFLGEDVIEPSSGTLAADVDDRHSTPDYPDVRQFAGEWIVSVPVCCLR